MRTPHEVQLAILTLEKELTNVPKTNFFGNDNHEAIEYAIKYLKGEITVDEVYALCDDEIIDDHTREQVTSFESWNEYDDGELVELLFNEDNLVTELPTNKPLVCSKQCGECPFSKKSAPGWLAEYTKEDILAFMQGEVSFPCHMMMNDEGRTVDECKVLIDQGEMRICRGYTEMLIKSCKSVRDNEQLAKAVALVREEGLSENSMSIHEFITHHKL